MKKQTRKFISGMLAIMFTFTLSIGSGYRQVSAAEGGAFNINAVKDSVAKSLTKAYSEKDNANWLKSKYGQDFVKDENKPLSVDPNEVVRVIVQMNDKPTAEAGSASLKTIKTAQASVKAKVETLQGVEIRHTYTDLVNGFSMTIKRSEINNVKKIAGVKSVTEAIKYYPDMTTAKSLTEVYSTWQNLGVKGEGMVVSIIDTGIDYTHKDMKITDKTKEKLTSKTPVGPGTYFSDKVPYGYNFAEMNTTVIPGESEHGMHVAGIVGANGSQAEVDKNEAIQGVAPECQLLAMKVFANDPAIGGAYTDDIIAAIEDSVKQGADVINMSLGSNSGFQDADQPEQKAIKNATDKGVMVVVSAGNSQYNTAPYKYAGLYDTGVVGSPGLTKDTLQVASYENSNMMLYALDYTSTSGNGSFTYEVNNGNPSDIFKGDSEIVDCGLGQVPGNEVPGAPIVNDFAGKDLTGKIALVSRGNIAFALKEVNAQAAGAKAIIIYNNRAGYIGGMVVDPTVTIPTIGMLQADGLALKDKISAELKLQFNGKLTSITSLTKDDMSSFTSWGPTPSLDFKPEITAPGGNIWSTVNNNKYENMSGTSMAAPHTSGAEALIMQAIKKANPSLTGRPLVELAKTTSINTSKTIMDKAHITVPYSPRRQGAGLVQIEDAIKNLVTVTDTNGNAAVALKEIGKTKTFDLNLKNYDTKNPITYTLSDIGGVLTEQTNSISSMSYDVKIAGATTTFDKTSVTVPANGTATVTVTVTLPSTFATERFVEGFVKFTATDKPSLVVPYIGFYGDWSKQDTIDKPVWDFDNSYYGNTELLTLGPDNNSLYYLGYTGKDNAYGYPIIDPMKIAISPNGDGNNENVYPFLTFLRNAKSMNIQVLDKDKNLVSQIAADENIRKNVFAAVGDNGFKQSMNWMWDGNIFNAATGKMESAPEGQYYLDYVTKVDLSTAKEQHFTMPVKVDLTAPEVTVKSPISVNTTNYKLEWTVEDTLSGDAGVSAVVLNDVEQAVTVTNTNGVYSCDLTLEKDKVNNIIIVAADNALNIAVKEVTVVQKSGAFKVYFDNLSSRMSVTNSDLTVTGSVSYIPSEFKINGENVIINRENLTFSVDITFAEGRNIVPIYALDIDGRTVLEDFSYKVDCDTIAPVLALTSPVIASDGKTYTSDDKVLIEGKVSDNTFGYKFYVNGEQKMAIELDGEIGNVATERSFSYEVPVINNSYIEIKAVDLFGNETIKNINVIVDKDLPIITITGVEDGKLYTTDVTPVFNANEGTVTATLNGKDYNGEKITVDGAYELIVNAIDFAGNTSTYKVNFAIDKTAPVITVTGVEDGKVYKTNVTPIYNANEGTVTATLNGKEYKGQDITVDGIYVLSVTAIDLAGNASNKTINFAIDKTAPAIITERLAGLTRIETSVAIAKKLYTDNKPDAIVLATADGFTDALAGSRLAYKYNAPLLLVSKSVNDSKAVLDYITTNLSKNKNIYILGGTGAVSTEVSDYLTEKGYIIIRICGKDSYETNQKIVDYLNPIKGTPLVLTTGDEFADSLSISSIVDVKGYSLLLNGKNTLSTYASDYITNIQPTTVYVIGGTGVLSSDIEAQIKKLNGNINIVRLGGVDRYETSMMIAEYFNLTTDTIALAIGTDYPDALSGSILAARRNSSVLLIDNKDITKQKAFINKKKIVNVIIFGGEGVISKAIENSLKN